MSIKWEDLKYYDEIMLILTQIALRIMEEEESQKGA
jgi:hypothetical protein